MLRLLTQLLKLAEIQHFVFLVHRACYNPACTKEYQLNPKGPGSKKYKMSYLSKFSKLSVQPLHRYIRKFMFIIIFTI